MDIFFGPLVLVFCILDLSTNARSKEDYLNKGCQSRIRGYLFKAESQLRELAHKNDISEKSSDLTGILANFKENLKSHKFHGYYFDRRCFRKSICDEIGEFLCEGKYDIPKCQYRMDHKINPYDSRESRIVFSTWNLDHV